MFIAPPPGYAIRENSICTPVQYTYGTLEEAIKGWPSDWQKCMIFGHDQGFSTCNADAEIKVSTRGFSLYIKSK